MVVGVCAGSHQRRHLARALDLPDTGTDCFVDDDGSIHENSINKIAAAGITVGCNPPARDRSVGDRYCGDEPVTRAQIGELFDAVAGAPPGAGSDWTEIGVRRDGQGTGTAKNWSARERRPIGQDRRDHRQRQGLS